MGAFAAGYWSWLGPPLAILVVLLMAWSVGRHSRSHAWPRSREQRRASVAEDRRITRVHRRPSGTTTNNE